MAKLSRYQQIVTSATTEARWLEQKVLPDRGPVVGGAEPGRSAHTKSSKAGCCLDVRQHIEVLAPPSKLNSHCFDLTLFQTQRAGVSKKLWAIAS